MQLSRTFYGLPGSKMAGRLLRPYEPRCCYREIPITVQEPDLAGFSESGLEIAGEQRRRAECKREGQGSPWLVVVPRPNARGLGERRLASLHSALRPYRCLGRRHPFSLDPVGPHLCSFLSRSVALQGGDVRRAAGSGVGLGLSASRFLGVLGRQSSVIRNQAAQPLPLARWIPLPPSLARKPPAKVQAPSSPLRPGTCLYCAGLDPFLPVLLG